MIELRPAVEKDRLLDSARRLATESLRLQTGGKLAEAERLAARVAEIRETELGAGDPDTALALQNLGVIRLAQVDYEQSRQLTERALRIRETLLGSEHPDVATSLSYLGVVWLYKEEYGRAVPLFQRALVIVEKSFGPEHPRVAAILGNLGNCHRLRGDLKKAEELFRRVVTIQEKVLGPWHKNVAVLADSLGAVYSDQGDYAAAVAMRRRAVAILEKTLSPEHPDLHTFRMNLASAYTNQGDYASAELLYEQALEMLESTLGPSHATTAGLLNNLATCLRLKGAHMKAEALYRRALGILEVAVGPDHPSVARVLSPLAMILEVRGDLQAALAAEQRAARITERELELNLAAGSERQKLAYSTLRLGQNNQILSMSVGSGAGIPAAVELGATTILRRKGRVQDAMASNLAALRRRFNPEGQRLFDRWKETTAELAALVLSEPRGDLGEHQKRIRTLEDRREATEDALNGYNAGFLERSQPVDVASIQSILPPDAALIEFAVYRRLNPGARRRDQEFGPLRYAAFVVRRDGAVHGNDLGDVAVIDTVVARFREALRDPKRRDVYELGRALDERVMQPLRRSLDQISKLLISPDGALNLVPFAALRDPGGRYLAEHYSVSYLTSGRDLLRLGRSAQSSGGSSPVILADPLFDASAEREKGKAPRLIGQRRSVTTGADLSSVYFAPLAGALQEARAIGALIPDSVVLTGSQATKESLKQVAGPRILHIATHGFFLDDDASKAAAEPRSGEVAASIENPLLRSGLALAGANLRSGDGQEGILTALEASGLNLWGTKLVTLSACDTGLGEVKNGEGVYGFRRALMLAGAETLVMSLWPVSDQVSRELMTAYYTGLKQSQGRGEALRQVQLQMIRVNGRQHPFYWASFIQSGEWANLDGKR